MSVLGFSALAASYNKANALGQLKAARPSLRYSHAAFSRRWFATL